MSKEAREFSTGKSYAIGDLVLYGGALYRFKASHSAGAWNDSQVDKVDGNQTQQQIDRILSAKEKAEKGMAYAETIVFSPELIGGTRYKYILTNAADPR